MASQSLSCRKELLKFLTVQIEMVSQIYHLEIECGVVSVKIFGNYLLVDCCNKKKE